MERRACYALVALERGIDRVGPGGAGSEIRGGALTYWSVEPLAVGERVEVPLGRAPKRAAGVVVEVGGPELADGIAPERVRPVLARTGRALPPDLVELARWIAAYYVCPLGMVLGTMVPAAVKRGIGRRTVRLLEPAPAPERPALLETATGLGPVARAAWTAIAALPPASFPMTPVALAAALGLRTKASLAALARAGLLRWSERAEVRGTDELWPEVEAAGPDPARLTAHQLAAVEGTARLLGGFSVALVRGVTGSGKTEVYLRVIERALAAGHTALMLVPEISLTPQTVGRLRRRFAGPGGAGAVAVMHSGLTASQRHAQWALAASGSARVVVGARSAVFAPVADLGLIVVDEEHAPDYKQDQLPRYHARDVAIKRAQLAGCPVLLGSATPSLESWANATASAGPEGRAPGAPKYRLFELPHRVGGGALPRVEIVDLAAERRALADSARHAEAGASSGAPGGPAIKNPALGPTLRAALTRTLAEGGQAILLLNRRGWASYLGCPSLACGWSLRCSDCDASLVQHRMAPRAGPGGTARRQMFVRCHHCLAEQRLPTACPVCARRLVSVRPGTQSVEEELEQALGLRRDEDLVRVDGDTMRSARDYAAALARFAAGRVRVLLGTQMIAKGLDYPNVGLVGVVDADTSIALPDFRAAERTFQLVSQVAGRAGRGARPGRVVVQTLSPGAAPIRHAAAHDYVGFAGAELATRRRAGLPPATRMARVVVRDRDPGKAERLGRELARHLEAARTALAARDAGARDPAELVRLDGPAPCAIERIAGFYRFEVLLTAPGRGLIQAVLASARAGGAVKSDAAMAVDIDPVALL